MLKSVRKQAKILKVSVDSTSISRVIRFISSRLTKKKKFFIVTPNPEQVMASQEDKKFKRILNGADISIPDGIGLVAANRFINLKTLDIPIIKPLIIFFQGIWIGLSIIIARSWLEKDLTLVRGRDLFFELIKLANKKHLKVYFLGGEGKEAMKAKKELGKNFKSVKIMTNAGPILNDEGFPKTITDVEVEKEVIKEINKLKPEILFVGFGAPKQEKWVYRWYDKLSIGGAMVLGGTFKFYAGERKSHPKLVEKMGLEWFWRLFTGSQNLKRIFTAFPRFAWTVYLAKLQNNTNS